MIRIVIFAVYDAKAEVYNPPFTMMTDGEAIRGFTDEVNRPGSALEAHPEDFTLFRLGTLDRLSGQVVPETAPLPLVSALQVRKVVNEVSRSMEVAR